MKKPISVNYGIYPPRIFSFSLGKNYRLKQTSGLLAKLVLTARRFLKFSCVRSLSISILIDILEITGV